MNRVGSIGAAAARRGRAHIGRAGLAVLTLIGAAVLAAGCGGGSSGQGVASLGAETTTTTTASSAVQSGSTSSPSNTAIAFVGCMRTHGEPNIPEPKISKNGAQISVKINASSGIDPSSPQFTGAYKACKRLLPNKGVPSKANTITPADQADYVNAAACMRSHGVPDFPDPSFTRMATSRSKQPHPDRHQHLRVASALTTCRKLIPAGLPYSSSSGTSWRASTVATPAGEPVVSPSTFDRQGRFAGYVAHELRTPMATQRALLELALADRNADVAGWREVGEDVLRACRQQERLLEACLARLPGANWGRSDPTRSISRQSPPTSSELTT